jgi:hypothetical protein
MTYLRPHSEWVLDMIRGATLNDARILLAMYYGNRSVGIKRGDNTVTPYADVEEFGTLMLQLDENDRVVNFYDLFEQRQEPV